jgi:hypothetical protein
MRGFAAVALAVAATVVLPGQAEAATSCSAIVHRAAWSPSADEETAESVAKSAEFGFGAEVDARVTADGHLVGVHDDTLRRVSGGTSDGKPEEMTLAEIQAVTLEHGGHVATMKTLVRATKRAGGSMLVEGKRYPEHQEAWDGWGIDALGRAITDLGMADRVYVGGTRGFTNAFHAKWPDVEVFWRPDGDEPLTLANAYAHHATLVEAGFDRWTAGQVRRFGRRGIVVATRNAQSAAEWQPGYDVGVRLWQTNYPRGLRKWCGEQ